MLGLNKKISLTLLSLTTFAFAPKLHAEKNPTLPPPYDTPSTARPSKVIGWPNGTTPRAPTGFKVSLLASLESPRSLYVLPNGDVLVSQSRQSGGQSSPNKITRLKIKDGKLESMETFAKNLNLPFGMALWNDEFFVAEPTQIKKFKYVDGKIQGSAQVIAKLPFPNPKHHWTRHLLLNRDGGKLYVSVGSASNVGESPDPLDPRTAAVLEMNRDGGESRIFASGLRNPVSLAWEPNTGVLWTSVNERDGLGDKLVPDYITSVKDGGFYGWPYFYWGNHEDPRRKGERPELGPKTIVPDFAVGAHTAALGITFTTGTKVPAPYGHGALVTLHGSWNSSVLVGYKVLFVPFKNGQAVDAEEDFLTGFVADQAKGTVYGRPVSSAVLADGSILVSDDGAGKIWKVTPDATLKSADRGQRD